MNEYNRYTKNEEEVRAEITKLIEDNCVSKETAKSILDACIEDLSRIFKPIVSKPCWIHIHYPALNANELAETCRFFDLLQRETDKNASKITSKGY